MFLFLLHLVLFSVNRNTMYFNGNEANEFDAVAVAVLMHYVLSRVSTLFVLRQKEVGKWMKVMKKKRRRRGKRKTRLEYHSKIEKGICMKQPPPCYSSLYLWVTSNGRRIWQGLLQAFKRDINLHHEQELYQKGRRPFKGIDVNPLSLWGHLIFTRMQMFFHFFPLFIRVSLFFIEIQGHLLSLFSCHP